MRVVIKFETVNALKWSPGILLLLTLVACGGKKTEANSSINPNHSDTPDITPLSDGSAYMVTYGEDHKKLWYVSGQKKTLITLGIESPDITPLADGTAILFDQEKLWSLKEHIAYPITEFGKATTLKNSKAGYYLALWHKSQKELASIREELEPDPGDYEGGY